MNLLYWMTGAAALLALVVVNDLAVGTVDTASCVVTRDDYSYIFTCGNRSYNVSKPKHLAMSADEWRKLAVGQTYACDERRAVITRTLFLRDCKLMSG